MKHLTKHQNLADISDATTARSNLGLVIGTNVLAQRTFGTAAASATTDFATASSPTLTGTVTLTDYTETPFSIGNTDSAKVLAISNGTVQYATLNASCTFTMPTATPGKSFTLYLITTGAFTATFTGVVWPDTTTAPVISTVSGKRVRFTFDCVETGIWHSQPPTTYPS